MNLIGKVEKKEGKIATIFIKNEVPCKEKCRNCSAGCNLFSVRIKTEVSDDVNEGDYVNIESKGEVEKNNRMMQYLVPVVLIIISIAAVQLLSYNKNKEAFTALAVLLSLIAAQVILKLNDKYKAKKYAELFYIGDKIDKK